MAIVFRDSYINIFVDGHASLKEYCEIQEAIRKLMILRFFEIKIRWGFGKLYNNETIFK